MRAEFGYKQVSNLPRARQREFLLADRSFTVQRPTYGFTCGRVQLTYNGLNTVFGAWHTDTLPRRLAID